MQNNAGENDEIMMVARIFMKIREKELEVRKLQLKLRTDKKSMKNNNKKTLKSMLNHKN